MPNAFSAASSTDWRVFISKTLLLLFLGSFLREFPGSFLEKALLQRTPNNPTLNDVSKRQPDRHINAPCSSNVADFKARGESQGLGDDANPTLNEVSEEPANQRIKFDMRDGWRDCEVTSISSSPWPANFSTLEQILAPHRHRPSLALCVVKAKDATSLANPALIFAQQSPVDRDCGRDALRIDRILCESDAMVKLIMVSWVGFLDKSVDV